VLREFPAPQATSFAPTPLDLTKKYAEWGIAMKEEFQAIPMISKDDADVILAVKARVEQVLTS